MTERRPRLRRVENRPDLVGDGWDAEPLMTARHVARALGISPKRVYELQIPCVRVFNRTLRYRPADVRAFIDRRTEAA